MTNKPSAKTLYEELEEDVLGQEDPAAETEEDLIGIDSASLSSAVLWGNRLDCRNYCGSTSTQDHSAGALTSDGGLLLVREWDGRLGLSALIAEDLAEKNTQLPMADLLRQARYYWLLLAEGHLTRRRFGAMLGRIALLPIPTG